MEDKNYYIVPDVHGREFWKALKDKDLTTSEVIFLGDYLDPYPEEGITPDMAIENFKELLEFVNSTPNITMLIGNHDYSYLFPKYRCSRHNYDKADEIKKLFKSYNGDWKLIKQIPELEVILSHAGICQWWWDRIKKLYKEIKDYEDLNILFKESFKTPKTVLLESLDMMSYNRGGYDIEPSPIWLDIRDLGFAEPVKGKQYVGHTGVYKPIEYNRKNSVVYDLDVQRIFMLNKKGLFNYDGTEIEDLTKIQ